MIIEVPIDCCTRPCNAHHKLCGFFFLHHALRSAALTAAATPFSVYFHFAQGKAKWKYAERYGLNKDTYLIRTVSEVPLCTNQPLK